MILSKETLLQENEQSKLDPNIDKWTLSSWTWAELLFCYNGIRK